MKTTEVNLPEPLTSYYQEVTVVLLYSQAVIMVIVPIIYQLIITVHTEVAVLQDMEPRKIRPPDGSQDGPPFPLGALVSSGRPAPHHSLHMPADSSTKPPIDGEAFKKLHQTSSCLPGGSGPPQQPVQQPPRVDYRDYKEKKERERLAQQTGVSRCVILLHMEKCHIGVFQVQCDSC
jgi:hypothetical protein